MAYVAAVLHALEGYLCEFCIGLVEGGSQVGCCGGDGEDAAAGGDDLAVFDGGAGVGGDYVFTLTAGVREGGGGFAGGGFAGGTAAGGGGGGGGPGAARDGGLG